MVHDPTLNYRWKKEAIFSFSGTNLKLETIKNSAGRYQTAVFETSEDGKLMHLGILFSKYYSSKEEAEVSHENIINGFIEIQKMGLFLINDVYSKIESSGLVDSHDGPKFFDFVRVPSGNAIVGRNV